MTDSGFEKITDSDQKLYGERKLILCGFPPETHAKFKKILEYADMTDAPLTWASEYMSDMTPAEIINLPDNADRGLPSPMPRAIILSGVTEKELHRLMALCKSSGMKQCLWAVLTPISQHWSLKRLLETLQAEHESIKQKKATSPAP